MIHHLLPILCNDLDRYLKNRLGVQEDQVLLSALMNLDGTVAVNTRNRMICTLLGVEQDALIRHTQGINPKAPAEQPLHLTLHLLFAAYFYPSHYLEALKALSYTLDYFHNKPVFTPDNTPGLDPGFERFIVEPVPLNVSEWSHIWSSMGANHMPGTLIRVRVTYAPAGIGGIASPEIPVLKTS